MSKETLRELFIKYLTVDSETKDARRKEFNQAIFDAKEGWAVWTRTDLDMVMEKFDKATKEWLKEELEGLTVKNPYKIPDGSREVRVEMFAEDIMLAFESGVSHTIKEIKERLGG